jgi:hypothetical protein
MGALYFPAIWGILAWIYGELLLFPRVYDEFFPRIRAIWGVFPHLDPHISYVYIIIGMRQCLFIQHYGYVSVYKFVNNNMHSI